MHVGMVASLARFPVKSMRGESLAQATVGLQGFDGDRRYAFVQAEARGLFPWFTAREYPPMLTYEPRWDTSGPRPALTVATPAGQLYSINDHALQQELETRSGRPLFLMRNFRGNYDVAPVSVITLATIGRIAGEAGIAADPTRFRANIVIDTGDNTPFTESQWVGHTLRIGAAVRVGINEPDGRCVMVTRDPHGGDSRPEVLRAVVELNGNNAGVYGVVFTVGDITAGDAIVLE